MKNLARSRFWWPTLSQDIEQITKNCDACNQFQRMPNQVPVRKWKYPSVPGHRVHADFMEFEGETFLVITDQHSKWLEVYHMKNGTTAAETIHCLRDYYARWGLIRVLVADNGPPFHSEEIAHITRTNKIQHKFSPPFFPQSNGAAENAVGVVKDKLKKAIDSGKGLREALHCFLLDHRTSINATTGKTPAALHLGRELRTRLDVLVEDCEESGEYEEHESGKTKVDDRVYVRDYRPRQSRWVPGVVRRKEGTVISEVETDEGLFWRRLDNQVRLVETQPVKTEQEQPSTTGETEPPALRRLTRERRPPNRLNL